MESTPENLQSNLNYMNTDENAMNYQNQNLSQDNNQSSSNVDSQTMWYDLSLISWFLLLCTGWSLYIGKDGLKYSFVAVYLNISVVGGFFSAISTIGFILYFKKVYLEKNQAFINAFQGGMTKFHSIPFLLATFYLNMFGLTGSRTGGILGLIVSFLSCILTVFVYFKTDFEAEWYEILTIKKGTFSCVFSLSWYTFFYFCGTLPDPTNYTTLRNIGIAFSIIIGLGNLIFSFYFKDLIVAIINLLLYIGIAKYFFGQTSITNFAQGIIDIIMIVLSFITIFYLLNKEREKIYKC
jgi:hypothetical protein